MASGPTEGINGTREKQRNPDILVYTRRAFKGHKKQNNDTNINNATNNSDSINTGNANGNVTTTVNTTTIPTPVENNGAISKHDTTAPTETVNDDQGNHSQSNGINFTEPLRISQSPAPDDVNLSQQHPGSGVDATQDVLSTLKPPQVVEPSARDQASTNGVAMQGLNSQINVDFASKSRQEKRELRKKLESRLDIVRNLVKKIEVKEGQITGFSDSHVLVNDVADNGGRRVQSEVASVGVPREVLKQSRPLNHLSVSVVENSQRASEILEKEKRTPKANQFYRNSEFLLAKDKFPPAESNKKPKSTGKKQGVEQQGHGFGMGSKVFKSCSTLLDKLMKHKHGWVFNTPVDVQGLGLNDYYTIIKHPMDLGSVKSRLNKNWYKSPREFAEDVRLTFHNAMTYNPEGQDVYVMADQLLKMFEDKWAIIEADYIHEMRFGAAYETGFPTPTCKKAPPITPPYLDIGKILNRSDSISYPVDRRAKPISITPSGRTPAPKKPKAKDPHKRDMTYEEKQKLSNNLQTLPVEKLDNIVQIIKKRNSSLFQDDDEIEVDIDSVDAETLWELDRFVTNYKKSLSKHKRKAELAVQGRQNAQNKVSVPPMNELPKEIGIEERNISASSPHRVQTQGDHASRSSSSSSSSSDSGSSSSDSDSGSSSASGSDGQCSPRT